MPDETEGTIPDQNELLFMHLVVMFQSMAYQHMGKVMNPATEKVERDLLQAKGAIDILAMLEEKTRGNLTENEQKMLGQSLFELRMNYVDEVNKDQEKPEEEEAGEDAGDAAAEGSEGESPSEEEESAE
jgi:hypothetical protein